MVDNKKDLKTYLILALCTALVSFISVRLAFGSAGIGGVLIGLYVIFIIADFVLYLMSEGSEKLKWAYNISLIGTAAIPVITTVAYLCIKNIK